MEDRETAPMRKYGESKTTQIMMTTVPHVTSGLGLRKFQADGFLLTRVYMYYSWHLNWLTSEQNNTKRSPSIRVFSVLIPAISLCKTVEKKMANNKQNK